MHYCIVLLSLVVISESTFNNSCLLKDLNKQNIPSKSFDCPAFVLKSTDEIWHGDSSGPYQSECRKIRTRITPTRFTQWFSWELKSDYKMYIFLENVFKSFENGINGITQLTCKRILKMWHFETIGWFISKVSFYTCLNSRTLFQVTCLKCSENF